MWASTLFQVLLNSYFAYQNDKLSESNVSTPTSILTQGFQCIWSEIIPLESISEIPIALIHSPTAFIYLFWGLPFLLVTLTILLLTILYLHNQHISMHLVWLYHLKRLSSIVFLKAFSHYISSSHFHFLSIPLYLTILHKGLSRIFSYGGKRKIGLEGGYPSQKAEAFAFFRHPEKPFPAI